MPIIAALINLRRPAARFVRGAVAYAGFLKAVFMYIVILRKVRAVFAASVFHKPIIREMRFILQVFVRCVSS